MDKQEKLKEMLDVFDVIDRIARLSDDVALTTEEAALFIRKSVTSIERMRTNGSGPAYIQGGGKSARGTNQKITYRLGALRAWRIENEVSSSMEAAVHRGMAFCSIWDAKIRVPFWSLGGKICGRVLDDTPDEYLYHREHLKIIWISSAKAVFRSWAVPEKHRMLVDAYKSALASESGKLQAVLEKI